MSLSELRGRIVEAALFTSLRGIVLNGDASITGPGSILATLAEGVFACLKFKKINEKKWKKIIEWMNNPPTYFIFWYPLLIRKKKPPKSKILKKKEKRKKKEKKERKTYLALNNFRTSTFPAIFPPIMPIALKPAPASNVTSIPNLKWKKKKWKKRKLIKINWNKLCSAYKIIKAIENKWQ